MPSLLEKWFPTPDSIRKEYVRMRQRDLDAGSPNLTPRLRLVIEKLMADHHVQGDWLDFYFKIHKGLKNSELTININAQNWFSTDNRYKTYSQTYERAVGDDKKMRLKGDALNPAVKRSLADDTVTLPDEWAHAHKHSQRRRVYDALSVTGTTTAAVMVDRPAAFKVVGPQITPTMGGDAKTGFTTSNKAFLPKAKQVFAALNYGKRPHGSAYSYGYSYLVLKPELKVNALYYPGDTFDVMGRIGGAIDALSTGVEAQASYSTIGTLILSARPALQKMFWQCFCQNKTLPDLGGNDLAGLLEAHIFKTVKVNRDVKKLYLCKTQATNLDNYSNFQQVHDNAYAWCKRNGVELELIM